MVESSRGAQIQSFVKQHALNAIIIGVESSVQPVSITYLKVRHLATFIFLEQDYFSIIL